MKLRARGYASALRRVGILGSLLTVALHGCAAEAPVEVPPRQISESPFHYPEELWDAEIEGETVLEIHVSAVGTVDSAKVERTSGYAEFDSAAVNGAHQLRFEPARRGEERIAVRVLLPVQFQLPHNDSSNGEPTIQLPE